VREELLRWLRCLACKRDLRIEAKESEGEHVVTGELVCASCSARYPVVRGVPRFVGTDLYTGSFSYQWNLFRRTQLDEGGKQESHRTFVEKTGEEPRDLAGKLVLDIGVGTGRFADVVDRGGATTIGIDLSFAVDAAYKNFATRPNMHVVQADVFDLPFAPETFDFIYSIGVLHHTRDTREAFLNLPPLLKPDGRVAIWVYRKPTSPLEGRSNSFWRSITTRLPNRVLLSLCAIGATLAYLKPVAKPIMKWLFPRVVYDCIPKVANDDTWRERVLNTFDWYSPRYQYRHTYPEVFGWFEEAGLRDLRILPWGNSVSGARR
jgi:SAM-dependent methyltransferase